MNWSNERPIEPGLYWFYGYATKRDRRGVKRLQIAEVSVFGDGGLVYIIDNAINDEMSQIEGVWQLMILPELPNESSR